MKKLLFTHIFFITLCIVTTFAGAGHDHSGHGHDHGAHDHEETEAKFNTTQLEELKIKIAKVDSGFLSVHKTYPGELRLNQDNVAHINPRMSGFIDDVEKDLGDYVSEGEILAYIDSPELGTAKADYIKARKELQIVQHDLNRVKEIQQTFQKSLSSLQNPESQFDTSTVTIDETIADFFKSYSRFKLAGKSLNREQRLFKEKVSSEESLLEAKSEFEKAKADFDQQKDQQKFAIERKVLETSKQYQVAKLKAQTARNRLILLGLESSEVTDLDDLNFGPDVTIIPLKAPINGFVIEKHLVLGERVTADSNVYTIAGLDDYWATFQVYANDVRLIQRNQSVSLRILDETYSGKIDYISELVNESTRSFDVRVTLPRKRGLKPGMFLEALVQIRKFKVNLLVPKSAVFEMDNNKVVFVKHGDQFEPAKVALGREDLHSHEVLRGLKAGQIYAVTGGFHIKSELQKGSLGDGHNH